MIKILRQSELQNKIGVVVGTRPSIIKMGPIIKELEKRKMNYFVIHAGQHYSYNMDKKFFLDLELPEPKYKLDHIKNCKLHGEQTGEMIKGIEKILIKEKPKTVLVCADANFNFAGALAARKLGLSSESSYRFERGIDINNVDFASLRATNLILKLAGGKLFLSVNTTKPKTKKKTLIVKIEEANRILGTNYSLMEIKRSLDSLHLFTSKIGKTAVKADIPSFRIDINQPVDLIEEIARVSGYENIPVKLPQVIPQDIDIDSDWVKTRITRDIILSQAANEVITYSLISRNLANLFGYQNSQLTTIVNPLSNQQEVLRPSIIPGLISCINYNINQKQKDIRIFEIGDIFKARKEKRYLSLAYYGKEFNILNLKGALELILQRFGISNFEFIKSHSEHPFFQKEISLSLVVHSIRHDINDATKISNGENEKIIATLGMIKPHILEKCDIKDIVFCGGFTMPTFPSSYKQVERDLQALQVCMDLACLQLLPASS